MVHQASPTLNMWTKKSANLGKEMALFGTPSQGYHLAHSFQHCWYTFVMDAQVTPVTAW